MYGAWNSSLGPRSQLAVVQLIQGNGRKLVKCVLHVARGRLSMRRLDGGDMSLQAIGSVLIGVQFARALCVISYREISSPKKIIHFSEELLAL